MSFQNIRPPTQQKGPSILKISAYMAGSLNIERVINTHTAVQCRKNSIIHRAPISDARRLRRDMARAVLVYSKNNPLPTADTR